MQINSSNNLNFQKRLIATTHVGSPYNPQPVKIYQMDEASDFSELKKQFNSQDWRGSILASQILYFFRRDYSYDQYLVMEADDKIIAYADVNNEDKYRCLINFLETAPQFAKYSHNDRTYKYAGETMLSCIAKLAKEKNKDAITLEYRDVKETRDFYFEQCGFEYEYPKNAILPRDKFDELIEQNNNHTGHSIDLVT